MLLLLESRFGSEKADRPKSTEEENKSVNGWRQRITERKEHIQASLRLGARESAAFMAASSSLARGKSNWNAELD